MKKRDRTGPKKERRNWRPIFLQAFADTGHVRNSCITAGVNHTTAYQARRRDLDFAKAWDEAEIVAAGVLEAEAWRRAHDGYDEAVYQKGELCGHVRKYSDLLLIFLLKGMRPDKYRERHDSTINLNGELRVTDVAAIRERFLADIVRHAPGGDPTPDPESLH